MCAEDKKNPFTTAGKVNLNTHFTDNFLSNEAFKTLRSNLLFCGDNIKTVLVTSSIAGEGKTTISTELAKSISQIDRKTLLIYGDMRKPTNFSREQKVAGLSELLSENLDVSKVIYNTQLENLDIIFSGALTENPSELLTSKNLKHSLDKLKEYYDYIIIDSPPLVPVIDAALISIHCDGAVLVIATEKTNLDEISIAKEQLKKSQCNILGAILNQSQKTVHSKYYEKTYSYYPKKPRKS